MSDFPHVWVDADSCPVKEEIIAISKKFKLDLTFVSNSVIKSLQGRRGIHHLLSSEEFDAVDNLIVEKVQLGDVAITKDLILAKRLLDKGVHVCGFKGLGYNSNINDAMANRNLHAMLRDEQGGLTEMTKNTPKVAKQQQISEFKNNFHNFLSQIMKKLSE